MTPSSSTGASMRRRPDRSALALPIALLLAALAWGCGGPHLRIRAAERREPAEVFFRAVRDGRGNALPPTEPEVPIGRTPARWPIPPHLLGGEAVVRLVFADGARREIGFLILPEADTEVVVARPSRAPK